MAVRMFDIGPGREDGGTCLLVYPQVVRICEAERKVARGTHTWVLIYWGTSDANSPEGVIRVPSQRLVSTVSRAECGLLRLGAAYMVPAAREVVSAVRATQRRDDVAASRLPDPIDSRMGIGRPVERRLVSEVLTYCRTGWVQAEAVLAIRPGGGIGPALREAVMAAGGDIYGMSHGGERRGKVGGTHRSMRDAQARGAASGQ